MVKLLRLLIKTSLMVCSVGGKCVLTKRETATGGIKVPDKYFTAGTFFDRAAFIGYACPDPKLS